MSCCSGNEARPTDAMARHALAPRSSPPGFQTAPSPCSSCSRWSACCLCSESSRPSCLLPPDSAGTVPSAQNTLILVSPLTLGTFANIVSLRGLPSAEVNPLFFPQMDPAHFPSTTNNCLILLFVDLLSLSQRVTGKVDFLHPFFSTWQEYT